ncbi:MAG: hypothetical protein HY892_09190 [Deltaproteobacteria bacterium]|nr:hypothetical protein [Deltaproteobacteria bacterium]
MPDMLTTKDIIEEIEFELAQGIIGRYGPGRSIGEMREFASRTRTTLLDSPKISGSLRDVIRKQFQLTEMLLKLLEESAASIESLQRNFEKHYRSSGPGPAIPSGPENRCQPEINPQIPLRKKYFFLNPEEILGGTPSHSLKPEMPVSRTRSVWMTRLVYFFKNLYHRPAYFYTAQLAKKQETVNQLVGDWLIKLNANNQNIFEHLENLSGRLARLEKEAGRNRPPRLPVEPLDS